MGIICGARKSFLELSMRIMLRTEAIDLQQEMEQTGSKTAAVRGPATPATI
jgi:hypothetical protein